MNKSIKRTILLAAALVLSLGTQAQTYGVTDEASKQNTPDGWTAVALPQLPEITDANTFTVTGLSATEDNTDLIQATLNKVPSTGGMVIIPAGTWLFGAGETYKQLTIKSKTILHLAAGCTLKLQPYGTAKNDKTIFITCTKSTNTSDIVIEGEDKETSIIDGDGWAWWAARENSQTFNPGAMIRFERGKRFLIKNLTLKDTPGVNITISNGGKASDATIHDVVINEPASELGNGKSSHNTDGVSIWGPRVNIYDCNISNGDDNVVVDSNGQYVHVWNCTFGTGHGASIGSYTENVKHIWFDNITMNGTTAGIRMKTGINSDGTLRGGGEEDITYSNITMTKVKNPFSMDCYYDKQYSADPATDEANARTLDSTTPTYDGILLQNVKTTDVCPNYAIFLVGRPESHIKNITLDNVQISAKKGIDIRWVDNLVFKNNSKISVSTGNIWVRAYSSTYNDLCNATVAGEVSGDDITYTLDQTTYSTSPTTTQWSFANSCSVTNSGDKSYAAGKSNTIKYSQGVQFTIGVPTGASITSVTFKGYGNTDNTACYLTELNGTSYDASAYSFAGRPTSGNPTLTTQTVKFDNPVKESLTFTVGGAQACFAITLTGKDASGIEQVYQLSCDTNAPRYSVAGVRVGADYKGIVIQNGKKFLQR